jgi:4-amino-4-deoxy-L-arabinose transferase-like glycosyltransferase
MPPQRPSAVSELFTLALFCAFLFFFGLNAFGLVGADEPRYAQVAREMLARRDWINPVLSGKVWLEKPVLYYWQAMAAYAVFGVRDWAARVPSALDATAMLLAVFLFLRRFRPGSQLDAALVTASSAAVIGFARAAATDMPLAAMFTVALLAWFACYESGSKRHLALFYVFLALATLAKGPVAVVLAAVIVLLFCFARGDLLPLRRTLWPPGILLFCVVALPWYVLVQLRNPEFLRIFLLEHNLARFGTNLYRHHQPFWYYLPVLLLSLVPWTVFAIHSAIIGIRSRMREARQGSAPTAALSLFLLIWGLVPVVFFSFSKSKLPGYILPAVPAWSMLLVEQIRVRNRVHPSLLILHCAVAAGTLGPAILVGYVVLHARAAPQAVWIAVCLSAAVFSGMCFTLLKRGLGVLRFVTLVPVILAVAILLRVGGATLDLAQSARPIARDLATLDSQQLPTAVFHASRETEYGLAFYRNQPIARYERAEVPRGEHLLVAATGSAAELNALLAPRRISRLGALDAQQLEYFWVQSADAAQRHGPLPNGGAGHLH